MFQADRTKPWTVIGVTSWGNFVIFTEIYIQYRNYYVSLKPKVQDVLKKGHQEFMLASIPITIGFIPKWP